MRPTNRTRRRTNLLLEASRQRLRSEVPRQKFRDQDGVFNPFKIRQPNPGFWSCEFAQDLKAHRTWHRRRIHLRYHDDISRRRRAFCNGMKHRVSLCADRPAVGCIFNITARKRPTSVVDDRGSNLKFRIGRVRVLARLNRGPPCLLDVRRNFQFYEVSLLRDLFSFRH